jgi:hypothetical protein
MTLEAGIHFREVDLGRHKSNRSIILSYPRGALGVDAGVMRLAPLFPFPEASIAPRNTPTLNASGG